MNAIENIYSRCLEGFRQIKEIAEENNERKEGEDKKDMKVTSPQKDKKEDKTKIIIGEDQKKNRNNILIIQQS